MVGNKCEISDVSSFHYKKKVRSNLCKRGTAHVHEQSWLRSGKYTLTSKKKKIPTRLTIASYHAMGDSHVEMQLWP